MLLSNTKIYIDGNELPYFKSCVIHQEINEHNELNLQCSYSVITTFCGNNNLAINDLIGLSISISTGAYAKFDFTSELKFKGIITGISYTKGANNDNGDTLYIESKSASIITDDGPHYKSYSEMSFSDIIKDSLSGYDASKFSVSFENISTKDPLTYVVQYNKSCYEFVRQLATRYGEWMYFNGENLVFGLPKNDDELELILGRDLIDYSTKLTPRAQKYKFYTNDYFNDESHEKQISASDGINSGKMTVLNDHSDTLFPKETQAWIRINDDKNSKNRLDTFADTQLRAVQANQFFINGTSDNPGVALAKCIKIDDVLYRVIRLTHIHSSTGQYENHFEAVSADSNISPKTNVEAFPKAQSQTAKVIDNHDPDKLGRIKVQFAWQKADGSSTPWIRVLTPHAGSAKGLYTIPEKEEEVMIDFEGQNAEQPYVIGALYNGKTKPPEDAASNANNDIKIFQTKSGCKFIFDDSSGSITISDKAGSSINMDGSGTVSISASNIKINGSDTINSESKAITTNGSDTISQTSKEITISGSSKVATDGAEITLSAQKTFAASAMSEATITGTAKATLSSSAVTSVEGTLVKIN